MRQSEVGAHRAPTPLVILNFSFNSYKTISLKDLTIRVLQNCVPPHLHFEKGEEITKKSIWKKVKKHHLDFNLVRDVTRFFQLLLQVFIFPLVVS